MISRNYVSALFAVLGVACLSVAGLGIRHEPPASLPPVPISDLGLTPEAAEATRQYVGSLPPLSIVGADSDADNQRKRVNLDALVKAANGGTWPFHGPQEAPDCNAFAFAGAVEGDIAAQIANGALIDFRPVDRPAVYAEGRIKNGRSQISGGGSFPSLAAENLETQGVLFADTNGVPPYSGKRSEEWGRKGIPQQFAAEMAKYKVKGIASCPNAQSVCNAIASGRMVAFGSMKWGTNSIKLVEGRNLARDTTDWPHAEIVTGYDGTLSNGQRLFYILNSWGPDAHHPLSQMPDDRPGGYYITWETMESICREGMAFVVSGTEGLEQRFVPDFRVLGASQTALTIKEPVMSPGIDPSYQVPLVIVGLCLLLVAWLLRGNAMTRRPSGLAVVAVLVMSAAVANADTPDFAALTMRPTQLSSTPTDGPNFALLRMPVQQSALLPAVELYCPTDINCPHCEATKTACGIGDTQVMVRCVSLPAAQMPPDVQSVGQQHGYPVIRAPDKRLYYGRTDLAGVKKTIGLVPDVAKR